MKNPLVHLTKEQLQKISGGTQAIPTLEETNNENDLNRGSGRP